MKNASRLDHLLLQRYPNLTRAQATSYIMQGRVKVDGVVVTKAGTAVKDGADILLELPETMYVCRAGYKLAHALEYFAIDVTGLVILDAGLSTGGFTDCLLQRGAARIYGVDVGYGQVHEKIRHNPHVVVMERTNLRYLEPLPELVDLVTLDLSFISVLKVMPAVIAVMKPQARLVILIKPQFEAGRDEVGRGGIISDPKVHERVIREITSAIEQMGFVCHGVTPSPILGTEGNQEFLAAFSRQLLA